MQNIGREHFAEIRKRLKEYVEGELIPLEKKEIPGGFEIFLYRRY